MSALEERMKCEVLSRHPILAFFVELAGRLMSRYQVGGDGRTVGVYFMLVRLGEASQVKLDAKWQGGAFIGIRDRSDEMLIRTPSGVDRNEGRAETPRVGAMGFSSSSRC